jgi:predicted ester cyclase
MTLPMACSAEIEANKASVHRFADEALNRGILGVVDQMLGEFAEQVKAMIGAWRAAFPGFHTTIETVVAEDDWVAFHLHHRGTHEGEFLGVPPTGRHVDFRTMIFNRFADGIVVENWGLHDHAGVLARLRSEP